MADVPPFLWADAGTFTSPHAYLVPGAGEVQPYTATATYVNNSGAAITPALRIKSSNGNLLALVFPPETIANGTSGEVTFVPPFGAAASSSAAGSGIQFDTDPQAGSWLVVTTTGTEPVTGIGAQITDSGGGGINFETTGFGQNGGGVYVQADDASAAGFPTALKVEANETSSTQITGANVASDSTGGTGDAVGVKATADTVAAASPTAVQATGSVDSGSGSGIATGVLSAANVLPTTGTGPAVALDGISVNHGSGQSIGVRTHARSGGSGTGDVIAALFTASDDVNGHGTLYGMQVFIGTTKVFQINQDGSLHGLTGKALTFDL